MLKFDIVNSFLFYFFNELKYKINESPRLVRFSKVHQIIVTSLNKIISFNDHTMKKNKSKSIGTEQRRI